MNKLERMKEIMKASPNFGKGVGYKMCVVDEFHDMEELKEQLEALANVNIKAQNIIGEAKEIIKLLLEDLRNHSYEPVKDIERAEEFLKVARNGKHRY